MTGTTRGQAYALEGVIGVLIIGIALILGMQIVDVAPADNDGDHLREIETQAADVMSLAREDNLLRSTATCVDTDGEPAMLDPGDPPDTAFETLLEETLENRGTYTITLEYINSSGTIQTESLSSRSVPQRASGTVIDQVMLYDSDPVRTGGTCTPTGKTLENASSDEFYLDDHDTDSEIYGMVKLKVIVW
ncbi:hypothetical protein Huta_2864 [Halorhabdus utahensis DSM 12940]|uniref:Uncharacterized protein n=1 Tax=Halorhabdus utahensis (strain DSM 12940 / JCM 11049 / AX-2) TaxID=519442 RepID=C7NRS0_HALUD|nr:hypothetical protein [Halorhabdus utahensis]ACV13025.1 hypothetical protein Huta_2864 [Halorhabdus utahensis DSM 12940]